MPLPPKLFSSLFVGEKSRSFARRGGLKMTNNSKELGTAQLKLRPFNAKLLQS